MIQAARGLNLPASGIINRAQPINKVTRGAIYQVGHWIHPAATMIQAETRIINVSRAINDHTGRITDSSGYFNHPFDWMTHVS